MVQKVSNFKRVKFGGKNIYKMSSDSTQPIFKNLKKLAQSDKFLLNKIFVQILTFDHISRMIWEEMMRVEVVGMP